MARNVVAPLFWISEAARLPQPKSVFPSPTVGLATEEYTHVHVLRFAQEHQG